MMKRWNKEIPIHDAIASRRCESTWQESLHELPAALQGTLCEQFGAPFAMAMLAWLRDLPAAPSPVSIHYTFLEIAYHWAYSRANLLPRPDPRRPNTWSPSTAVHGPTHFSGGASTSEAFFHPDFCFDTSDIGSYLFVGLRGFPSPTRHFASYWLGDCRPCLEPAGTLHQQATNSEGE